MPLPLIIYGALDCDDTERTRRCLGELGIPYQAVSLEQDDEAERFVRFINRGNRSTPTLVFGEGKFKIIITEPTEQELNQVLKFAGYPIPITGNESGGSV